MHLVIGYSHVLLDGVGIRALAGDLEHFDRAERGGRSRHRAAAGGAQRPLDVARAQSAPRGAGRAAVRFGTGQPSSTG